MIYYIEKFDKELKIKSINFIKNILLKLQNLYLKNNFRFGNKREGIKTLIKYESFCKYK